MGKISNVISLSGELGSGKSSVANILREKLEWPVVSTGAIQRQLAADMGMTTLELNLYAEDHPEIDDKIDNTIIELGKSGDNAIVDSRLAWHFIPQSLKVFLTVDEVVAARRIRDANRDTEEGYNTEEEAVQAIRLRRQSETQRFSNLYKVELGRWKNFDLIVNTTAVDPETVAETIYQALQADERTDAGHYHYFVSPKACFPLASAPGNDPQKDMPILLRSERVDYMWGNTALLETAIDNDVKMLEAHVQAIEEDKVDGFASATEAVQQEMSPAALTAWQQRFGFEFHRQPPGSTA